VIFYDRLVDPDVLELARRDAERVFVGKHVGAHAWPQDRINAMIVAEAARGRKVVRLKSGDPGVFGRATEELQAARDVGISIDIVPGVTAASAAGAALGRSLTERGATDTLVIATGSGCFNNPLPESVRLSGPGTTTAFYMSVRQAGRIARSLREQGLPGHSPIDLCANISKKNEHLIRTTVRGLPGAVVRHGIRNEAIILVSWPRDQAAAEQTVPSATHGLLAHEIAN
jgi:uroporphyrin-III C-methyltransferase/precorrin-2 dehydrogenase/sirohydrochlorin ferrochelatase